MIKWTPGRLKFALNIYGPFLGAGIRIKDISQDWTETKVSMKLRWYNRNAVGAHFGGSLYSMVDPQLMMMLMQLLGKEYIVWDKAAAIEFVSPGRGEVSAVLRVTQDEVQEILTNTESGKAYLPKFEVEILSDKGELIAKVLKTLYVRKKRRNNR